MQLQVRRLGNAVELVVVGAGPAPQLQQLAQPNGWQGQLTTASPTGLRVGPQRLSMPELGFQSVSLDGSGSSYSLSVTPMPGVLLARPVVSADGVNLILTFPASPQVSLQTNQLDLSQPGAVPQPAYAPPLQARAVAPPLGDMAVGTMTLRNPLNVEVSGPPVTMTLKNAPARDALMALAQQGGYGFAFTSDSGRNETTLSETRSYSFGTVQESNTTKPAGVQVDGSYPVTVAFKSESYQRAFNFILAVSGLQAKKDGNVIIVGPRVSGLALGSLVSKVYRLNQVSPNASADYLANLGASVTKTNTITTAVTQGVSQSSTVSNAPSSATTQSSSQTRVEAYGASAGPLIGLRATTDTRLGTITLVGSSSVVVVAEQYLRQLDLRQRQVALSVKILDVNLDNDSVMENSFAIRWGNNFIVNDGGELLGAFGNNLPPSYNPLTGFSSAEANPGTAYPKNQFYDFLRAQIISQSTKLLASPTLILQENPAELRAAESGSSSGSGSGQSQGGSLDEYSIDSPIGRRRANEGVVRVGTNVITQYQVNNAANSAGASNIIICQPTLSTAGLVLGARIEKIDDNGFVTFALSPSVSAVTDREPVPGCGNIDILSVRRLDTGALRVRDGQTLIMTGVISEFDRAEVSKWPVLSDMPLIGSLFRSSGTRREKRELVIMVTPKIINDVEGGVYGYGYQPSTPDARSFMGASGY
ncbi:general secretion pathway protein D [Cyanobium sp. Alchichica 3B3-8F6]|uniref:general secretion pathway protein D n=1 Tax=Cyanobium sp. Alchichica 3B3-8F6 TaxID=2823696 RepID=UPI0020CBFC73|nr:general secretion pathway protein D [Cyanobium sp. Alchichica 3B3-8F6]MCP9882240.1 general secretion pathway protein D [Cyanobium sp. Alchichica 3B3-8F6]